MANTLFELLDRNKYRLAGDQKLWDSYWEILGAHKSSTHYFFLSRRIGGIMRDGTRFDYVAEFQVAESDIPIRHRKDVFLGQIARQVQNRLICVVCKDKRTRQDLNDRMHIPAMSLRDSLQFARSINP